MKLVSITGGLGNQMFIYAFCLSLRQKGQHAVLFVPFKLNAKKYGHQGYELEKLFTIQPAQSFKDEVTVFFLGIYSNLIRVFPFKYKLYLYQIIGIQIVSVTENFIYYPEVYNFRYKQELYKGTWQSELYFEDVKLEVRNSFIFNENLFSDLTKSFSREMKRCNSVSIHIRRGDYLSNEYKNGFAEVCTEEYYKKAIEFISAKIMEPFFFVFYR